MAATSGRSDSRTRRSLRRAAGEWVFRQGDLGAEMFIIREGEVEILREGEEGRRRLAVLEKGDFFGEMSLLEGEPRNASARALTDLHLVQVDGTTFDRMLRDHPEIAVRIMRKLSRRVREATEMLDGPASPAREPRPRPAPREREAEPAESPQPVERPAPIARLLHPETGAELLLEGEGPHRIGRRDPVTGIQPEIDLSAIDPERSSSRQHATVVSGPEGFQVIEGIGTTNGTFLNGTRLRTAVPAPIRSGDTLRFGLVEVEFRAG